MPETAVHKTAHLGPGENNVRPGAPEPRETHIYAISQSSPMEFPPDGEFGGCVPVPKTAHQSPQR